MADWWWCISLVLVWWQGVVIEWCALTGNHLGFRPLEPKTWRTFFACVLWPLRALAMVAGIVVATAKAQVRPFLDLSRRKSDD